MKKIIRDPLIQFVFAGFMLFLLYEALGKTDDSSIDSKTILVDKNALLELLQYRAKTFQANYFESKLASMSAKERNQLIEDYIREEVLYREALSLGLDSNDYVIRRRMVSKAEFVINSFAENVTEEGDAGIEQYFEANRADYYIAPTVTFTHIFFDGKQQGKVSAEQRARLRQKELNETQAAFTDARKYGDRFLYKVNYVEQSRKQVASHFGVKMMEQIFNLKPDASLWHGPYESPYGMHLVMLSSMTKGISPEINDIYPRVAQDAKKYAIRQATEEAIQRAIDNYDIRLVLESPDSGVENINTVSVK